MATNGLPLPKYLDDVFHIMENSQPPYPKELIETIGAYQGDGHARHWHEQARPYFKGWAGTVDGMTRFQAEMGIYPEDLSKIGYVGLWVGRTALNVIFCVIPSMNTGSAQPGESIDMGVERVAPGQYTPEELDGLVLRGWQIMNETIEKCGAYIPKLKGSILPQA